MTLQNGGGNISISTCEVQSTVVCGNAGNRGWRMARSALVRTTTSTSMPVLGLEKMVIIHCEILRPSQTGTGATVDIQSTPSVMGSMAQWCICWPSKRTVMNLLMLSKVCLNSSTLWLPQPKIGGWLLFQELEVKMSVPALPGEN